MKKMSLERAKHAGRSLGGASASWTALVVGAWIVGVFAVGACGDDTSAADAGPADAGVDAAPSDASASDAAPSDASTDAGDAGVDCRAVCEHGHMICPATFPDVARCVPLCMASRYPDLAPCEMMATDCASANACFGG